MAQTIPLFPLNTVLFPGAPLTLHIFEQRYRMMIAHCLDEGLPFGVVLIRAGEEVGMAAVPYPIGTLAQINANVRLDDGRYYIATVGQQRFQIEQEVQQEPYMLAEVTLLPEETGSPPVSQSAVQELRQTYDRYWQAVAAATGFESQVEQLPDDPVELAYQLADRLQVTNERKQRWLEGDLALRVNEIAAMLRAELSLLPRSGRGSVSGTWQGLGSWN